MNMYTSKCLSLCFLVAAAASEGGADPSCAVDEDAVVALQSTLQNVQGDDSASLLQATTLVASDAQKQVDEDTVEEGVAQVLDATEEETDTDSGDTTNTDGDEATGGDHQATATCVEGSVRRRRSGGDCACRRRSKASECINNEFVATCATHVCQTGWVWRAGVLTETNPDEAKCCEEACSLFTTQGWFFTEQTCPSARCSWSGTRCEATSCDTYTASSACPSDRCKWSGGLCQDQDCRGMKNQANCEASPNVCGWTAHTVSPCTSQYRVVSIGGTQETVSHGTGVVRPQYRTAFHKGTATDGTWKGCSGLTNCWGGELDLSKQFPVGFLKGGLTSSEYTVTAVEVFIDCKISTNINLQRRRSWETNVNLQASYKDNILSDFSGTTETWNMRNFKVDLTEEDDPPIFRVEVSREPGSSQDAAFKMMMQLEYVSAVWDRCMNIKDQHSQCLSVFANIEAPLRSDHQMQIECLDGTDTSPTGCSEWLTCLGDTVAKATLLKMLKALATLRTDLLLAQDKPVTQALVQSRRSTGNCKNPSANQTCADPDNLDVEAYDCECLSWAENATATEIAAEACVNNEVCCDWKEIHCTGFTADPQLLQRSRSQESLTEKKGSQDSLLQRSAQMDNSASLDESLEASASLDDSLSGKATCPGKV